MAQDVNEKIKEQINADRVVIYMKGTKDFPQCGFSYTVVEVFKRLGVPFQTVNVLADYEVREGIKQFSNWPTIPQVYINGQFIGGCDIVRDLYERGELEGIVKEALEAPRHTL